MTTTQSPPPGLSSTAGPSNSFPSQNSPDGSIPVGGSTPSVSLVLYIFSVILALFVTIFAALVTRSVRRRRQRNATFAAALASGTYAPSIAHRGNQDGASVPKPFMWEALITPVYDEGKGWAGISPVAGVTSVPAHEAKSQQPASRQPRLRFPYGTRPAAPNLPPPAPSLESLASASNPVYLTVLVSMPSPRAHERARQGNEGPPVVEFGVAESHARQMLREDTPGNASSLQPSSCTYFYN